MKLNIYKFFPFLAIILLSIFLILSNQRQYTKLKILIWETPTLTLGTYLSLSTASGFLISFLISNNISKYNQPKLLKNRKKTNCVTTEEGEDSEISSNNFNYENTLIERSIKDPSPTINANFRVIGNYQKQTRPDNYKNNSFYQSDASNNFDEEYYNEDDIKKRKNDHPSSINDWNDNSYISW
tara:strand:- start:14898 stop:15446 length:549 start_codon:yes stop_codon:yes gene_type:complete